MNKKIQKLIALFAVVVVVFGAVPAFSAAKKKSRKQPQVKEQTEDAQTQLERGLAYYKQGNYSEAVKWLRKAAQQGLPEAQDALRQLGETW